MRVSQLFLSVSRSAVIWVIAGLSVCALLVVLVGCRRAGKLSSSPPSDPRIVGSWTIVGGDYPLTNIYRADGTFVQRVGGRETQPQIFRIEGEHLITRLKQPDGSVGDDKERFAIDGDTLTFFDADGSKRIFRKQR